MNLIESWGEWRQSTSAKLAGSEKRDDNSIEAHSYFKIHSARVHTDAVPPSAPTASSSPS